MPEALLRKVDTVYNAIQAESYQAVTFNAKTVLPNGQVITAENIDDVIFKQFAEWPEEFFQMNLVEIDAEMYGLKGDGTDETERLQAIISAADFFDGVVVRFKPRTYLFNNPVFNGVSKITLRGEGFNTVFKSKDDATVNNNIVKHVITFVNSDYVKCENIHIDGNRQNRPVKGVGLKFITSHKCEATNVWTSNCSMAGVEFEASSGGRAFKCWAYNCVHGVQWWGGNSANETTLGVQDIIVDSCHGEYIDGSPVWGSLGKNITVVNCTGRDCGDVGVDFEGCEDSTAANNKMYNCTNGCYAGFFGGRRNKYIGNTGINGPLSQLRDTGFGFHGYGAFFTSLNATRAFYDLTFIGNTIQTYDTTAIHCDDFALQEAAVFKQNNISTTTGSSFRTGPYSKDVDFSWNTIRHVSCSLSVFAGAVASKYNYNDIRSTNMVGSDPVHAGIVFVEGIPGGARDCEAIGNTIKGFFSDIMDNCYQTGVSGLLVENNRLKTIRRNANVDPTAYTGVHRENKDFDNGRILIHCTPGLPQPIYTQDVARYENFRRNGFGVTMTQSDDEFRAKNLMHNSHLLFVPGQTRYYKIGSLPLGENDGGNASFIEVSAILNDYGFLGSSLKKQNITFGNRQGFSYIFSGRMSGDAAKIVAYKAANGSIDVYATGNDYGYAAVTAYGRGLATGTGTAFTEANATTVTPAGVKVFDSSSSRPQTPNDDNNIFTGAAADFQNPDIPNGMSALYNEVGVANAHPGDDAPKYFTLTQSAFGSVGFRSIVNGQTGVSYLQVKNNTWGPLIKKDYKSNVDGAKTALRSIFNTGYPGAGLHVFNNAGGVVGGPLNGCTTYTVVAIGDAGIGSVQVTPYGSTDVYVSSVVSGTWTDWELLGTDSVSSSVPYRKTMGQIDALIDANELAEYAVYEVTDIVDGNANPFTFSTGKGNGQGYGGRVRPNAMIPKIGVDAGKQAWIDALLSTSPWVTGFDTSPVISN